MKLLEAEFVSQIIPALSEWGNIFECCGNVINYHSDQECGGADEGKAWSDDVPGRPSLDTRFHSEARDISLMGAPAGKKREKVRTQAEKVEDWEPDDCLFEPLLHFEVDGEVLVNVCPFVNDPADPCQNEKNVGSNTPIEANLDDLQSEECINNRYYEEN